jgi:hypothetical protein
MSAVTDMPQMYSVRDMSFATELIEQRVAMKIGDHYDIPLIGFTEWQALASACAVNLVGFETLFQLLCPEAREKWRKIVLRCDARILIDHQKLFLFITPCRPIGQARSVRVTCLCEVGPIGLQQVGQRRIISS